MAGWWEGKSLEHPRVAGRFEFAIRSQVYCIFVVWSRCEQMKAAAVVQHIRSPGHV